MLQRPSSPAAEFPNDNPALHAGAIWVCLEVCGPTLAEVPTMSEKPNHVEVEAAVEASAEVEEETAMVAVEDRPSTVLPVGMRGEADDPPPSSLADLVHQAGIATDDD